MRGVGRGLVNDGNTCYLNSALQCLAYCPPFYHYVMERSHKRQCTKTGFCSLCCVCTLVEKLHGVEPSRQPVLPSVLLNNLRAVAPSMRRHRQEDAHEWLRFLINSLQGVLEREAAGSAGKCDPRVAETSWMFRLFGGHIVNEVKVSWPANTDIHTDAHSHATAAHSAAL